MRIGLIDVDGHNFPNLALMKLSAWHKAQGDTVEWWQIDAPMYDRVYMSKVFSDTYSPDHPTPPNAREIVRGGSGYAITTEGGREKWTGTDPQLPEEIEHSYPDYSLYPKYTGWGGGHQETDRVRVSHPRLPARLRILSCRRQGRTSVPQGRGSFRVLERTGTYRDL